MSQANKIIKRRLRSAYLSSVISISLVLLLVGVASLLMVNSSQVMDHIKSNMQVSVLLNPEVQEDDAYVFKEKLDSLPFVSAVTLVTRDQGESEMKELLGEDFMSVFETSPIPVSFNMNLLPSQVTPEGLMEVRKVVEAFEPVDEVVYQQDLVEDLSENLGKISGILAVMIGVLLFISFVLISNMMRLSFLDKRQTVYTMKLVGATPSFIRRPFMEKAALMGLFASVIATLLLLGILFWLRTEFLQMFEVFSPVAIMVSIVIIVLFGLLICLLSTRSVANKMVAMTRDELYY